MTHIAIRAEGLSKVYRIGHHQHYTSLRESLVTAMRAPARLARRLVAPRAAAGAAPAGPVHWALQDVSFEVPHGEVLAVIGRNGAGKSTLLKLLSRITEPTRGRATLHGRVGSLLEVGTGFHPELTGRENVFMNGALLGMRRVEIEQDFDNIVEFAEIAQFIDTPVKYYSSGMSLRLAFAVAVHLRPEILIVDEVLAVGDAQFQKRCMNKMREVSRQGRTILFVSHNMAAMRLICDRAIHLEKGRLVDEGDVNEVVDRYLAKMLMSHRGTSGVDTPTAVIEDVQIRSLGGPVIKAFDPIEVSVTLRAKIDEPEVGIMAAFTTLEQQRLAALAFNDLAERVPVKAGQITTVRFIVESLPFLPGSYQLELHLKDWQDNLWRLVPEAFGFDVVESPVYGERKVDASYGLVGLRARAESEVDRGAGRLVGAQS